MFIIIITFTLLLHLFFTITDVLRFHFKELCLKHNQKPLHNTLEYLLNEISGYFNPLNSLEQPSLVCTVGVSLII